MSSFDPTSIWALAAAAVLGYLLGSIPFGLVLTKAAGLGDIRSIGSGNIGATNVLRTGNKGLALATLLLDGGKGAVAVLVAGLFDPMLAVIAGGGAMLGHNYPVWLGFKGGKGVATALGTLLAIMWPVGALCCLIWLVTALLFRYSSLASLTATAAAPILALALSGVTIFGMVWTDLPRAALALFIAVLVFIRHDGNIRRLLRGEEPKIGRKKTQAAG
jgi:glycerol-3-phosphate acyltransferase PlsY